MTICNMIRKRLLLTHNKFKQYIHSQLLILILLHDAIGIPLPSCGWRPTVLYFLSPKSSISDGQQVRDFTKFLFVFIFRIENNPFSEIMDEKICLFDCIFTSMIQSSFLSFQRSIESLKVNPRDRVLIKFLKAPCL